MAKRFEDVSIPTFVDLVTAYQLLGIDNLLGDPGKHTAFAMGGHRGEEMVFHVLPGDWSDHEFAELMELAVAGITPPSALPMAA